MRHARVKAEGTGCYHVVSRIVDRAFKLDDGEKEIFRTMMRKAEAFSGVRVLTYAIMSNHFHLLVVVPERGEVGGDELVRRMTVLYGREYVADRVRQWDEWRGNGAGYLIDREQDNIRKRMGDVSAFVKTLKQRYSMSYNSRHGRTGTLWEERFKSVLVENGESAKAVVAAYIDLNPVRAGLVSDPKDYRWSGYGEACGGSKLARDGLIEVHDSLLYEQRGAWRHVARATGRFSIPKARSGTPPTADRSCAKASRVARPTKSSKAADGCPCRRRCVAGSGISRTGWRSAARRSWICFSRRTGGFSGRSGGPARGGCGPANGGGSGRPAR